MSIEGGVTDSLLSSGTELLNQDSERVTHKTNTGAGMHTRHLTDQSDTLLSLSPEENDTTDETLLRDEDLPPLHFNTLRSPARLRGVPAVSQRNVSRSSSRSRSRSSSPVPQGVLSVPAGRPCATGSVEDIPMATTSVTPPGELKTTSTSQQPILRASSERSLLGHPGEVIVSVSATTDKHGHHHLITEDMLTDRLGLGELTPPVSSGASSPVGGYSTPLVSSPHITLACVIERMSEESLDDVHAFNDVKLVKKPSFGSDRPSAHGSTGGEDGSCNNSMLDTLEEEDFEDEEDEEEDSPNREKEGEGTFKGIHSQDDETRIMFEMLDLLSTNAEERRKLEEEKQKKMGRSKDVI